MDRIPPDHLQKLGQDSYKRKDFKAALHSFNSALEQANEIAVNILDNRAATYEKLGDLQAALRDARRMISLKKTSCAAYLRTGKILQLLGEDRKALDIYEHGSRILPSSDPNLKLLRQLRERASCVAKDPLMVLPAEVAKMIMNYLDFEELVSLTRVSKNWRDFLRSTPSFWTRLDFSKARRKIPSSAIERYLRCSQRRVTYLAINRHIALWKPHLYRLIAHCAHLGYLKLDCLSSTNVLVGTLNTLERLHTLVISGANTVSLCRVRLIIIRCSTLIRAEFHRVVDAHVTLPWDSDTCMPGLRSLTLEHDDNEETAAGRPSISGLLDRIPNVHALSLTGWAVDIAIPPRAKMTQLEELRLIHCEGDLCPLALPSLRILNLIWCEHILEFLAGSPETHDLRTSSLVELSLAESCGIDAQALFRLLGSKTEDLRKLDINSCWEVDESDLKSLVDKGILDQVVDLDLSGTHVTDEVIELLALRSHQLRRINFAMTKITGVSIKALITKTDSKLEYLNIRDCSKVSADAVAFARNQPGLTVQCSFSDVRGGKKIRYG